MKGKYDLIGSSSISFLRVACSKADGGNGIVILDSYGSRIEGCRSEESIDWIGEGNGEILVGFMDSIFVDGY